MLTKVKQVVSAMAVITMAVFISMNLVVNFMNKSPFYIK